MAGLADATPVAGSCALPPEFIARGRLESADVVLVFRTMPAEIEIGRHFVVEALVCTTPPAGGLQVDAHMQTSIPGIYAGGDCTALGQDLTVQAVQHGKLAAEAIHAQLMLNVEAA